MYYLMLASIAAKGADRPEKPLDDVKKQAINQVFLPENSLVPDSSRSLVSIEFDKQNRLVATFSDGKTIKTKPNRS